MVDESQNDEKTAIELSLMAVAINAKFQDAMADVLRNNSVTGRVAGTKIKSLDAILSKASKKYNGNVTFVLDIVRCRCVFRDPSMLRRCYHILTQQYNTVRVKNLFDERMPKVTFRYVIVNMVFKTESQQLCEWFADKHASEECRRFVRNNPHLNENANDILNDMKKSTANANMIVEVQLTLETYTKFSEVREMCHDLFTKNGDGFHRSKSKVKYLFGMRAEIRSALGLGLNLAKAHP